MERVLVDVDVTVTVNTELIRSIVDTEADTSTVTASMKTGRSRIRTDL